MLEHFSSSKREKLELRLLQNSGSAFKAAWEKIWRLCFF